MFIPYSTDAPLYHFPWVTIGLIAVNVGCFFGVADPQPVSLALGDGLHPTQWLTSIFLHADIFHLLGNMVFLWCFGLIVEGKIGWWRFLLVYLAIGVAESLLSQVLMLFSSEETDALGASAAIFGLVAIAAVWAPRNELHCVAIVYFRPIHFELSLLIAAFVFVAWNVVLVTLDGFSMSGAMSHLFGAGLGAAIGFLFLIRGWVDCEGYDLVSVWRGREGRRTESKTEKLRREESKQLAAQLRQDRVQDGRKQVTAFLRENNTDAAIRLFEKLRHVDRSLSWSQRELLAVIKQLLLQQAWDRCVPLMEEYLQRFSEHGVQLKLHLARVLVLHQQRPTKAQKLLGELDGQELSAAQDQLRRQLLRRARQLQQDGVIELRED